MAPIRRLSIGYVVALALAAAFILSAQILIQGHLNRQSHDATLVNVAGRQRMLSQRLCALGLAIDGARGDEQARLLSELASAADTWEQSARSLRSRPELLPVAAVDIYAQIEPYQAAMLRTVRGILADPTETERASRTLMAQGDAFLEGMERIVTMYDHDAVARVTRLGRLELLLVAGALSVLLLEGLFVFRPLVRGVKRHIRDLEEAKRTIEASLAEKRALEQQLIGATDHERRRLGEDLHDGLCQQLVGTTFLLRSLEPSLQGAARASLGEAMTILEGAVEQMRRMAKGLHPVGVELHGLVMALCDVAATTQATFGVACEVSAGRGVDAVESTIAMHAFRVAQEAVVNAARHAKATRIDLRAELEGDTLTVSVEDNGVGIAGTPGPGMGLRAMRSRAELAAAHLVIEGKASGGTLVRCEFPNAGKATT
jgi:signal transduction histidine kinase